MEPTIAGHLSLSFTVVDIAGHGVLRQIVPHDRLTNLPRRNLEIELVDDADLETLPNPPAIAIHECLAGTSGDG